MRVSRVLMVGMRATGAEICKNLVLTGIGHIPVPSSDDDTRYLNICTDVARVDMISLTYVVVRVVQGSLVILDSNVVHAR